MNFHQKQDIPPVHNDAYNDERDDELGNDLIVEESSAMVLTKKKSKKKKKKAPEAVVAAAAEVVVREDGSIPLNLTGKNVLPITRGLNPGILCDSFLVDFPHIHQSWPPSIPIAELCALNKVEPKEGQILEHAGDFNRFRVTSEELRAMERGDADMLRQVRIAAECHREVRKFAQSIIQPGISLLEMCEEIEARNRLLVMERGLEQGIGFPTGCSLNHVAAHYTPNCGDKTVLHENDVMKLDFGTHIRGRIVDCAFTVAFNPRYDELLKTVREATDCGVRACGIDVRICEVGEAVQECMEAGEVELDGQIFPIRCCRNLTGHSIDPYVVHARKNVPIVRGSSPHPRMEEGEFYAIETFGSTGRGYVVEDLETSHYMKNPMAPRVQLRLQTSQKLLAHINKTFGTLGFCRRWLERDDGGSFFVNGNKGKQERYLGALKNLCDVGILSPYPPLCEVVGSYVAQYEHTLILRPTCKEVLSRGDDF